LHEKGEDVAMNWGMRQVGWKGWVGGIGRWIWALVGDSRDSLWVCCSNVFQNPVDITWMGCIGVVQYESIGFVWIKRRKGEDGGGSRLLHSEPLACNLQMGRVGDRKSGPSLLLATALAPFAATAARLLQFAFSAARGATMGGTASHSVCCMETMCALCLNGVPPSNSFMAVYVSSLPSTKRVICCAAARSGNGFM
jgi:hypothetical protein